MKRLETRLAKKRCCITLGTRLMVAILSGSLAGQAGQLIRHDSERRRLWAGDGVQNRSLDRSQQARHAPNVHLERSKGPHSVAFLAIEWGDNTLDGH